MSGEKLRCEGCKGIIPRGRWCAWGCKEWHQAQGNPREYKRLCGLRKADVVVYLKPTT